MGGRGERMAGAETPLGQRRRARRTLVSAIDAGIRRADDNFGIAKARKFLDHIFPDHWSFLFGEIALYSFLVLILTGVFLALYFDASDAKVVYHGPYTPLYGHKVSLAYQSVVNISLQVRGGLLFRQMHHWAADLFIWAILVHLCRVFFTGAFRRPRAANWMVGVTMLFLAIINGYCGYSLPGDLLSGVGLRIGYSIIESMPVVGSYGAAFLFGGVFPGNGSITDRLYIAHVFIIPIAITVLLSVHLGLIMRQKHTQFAGKGRTERNVVGSTMYPRYALKSIGTLLCLTGVLALLGGLFQINPIWQYGEYEPYLASYAAQPDWYMGWIEGAMRLMPGWEFSGFGHTIPFALFVPAVLMPTATYLVMMAWPFVDPSVFGDKKKHDLLQRPRDNPRRTAFGAGVLAFYSVMFIGAADDLVASFFHLPLQAVLWTFRLADVFVPFAVGIVVWRICVDLQRPKEGAGTVVLAADHYLLEPAPDGTGREELEPEEVPTFVVPGPVTVTVPAPAKGGSGG